MPINEFQVNNALESLQNQSGHIVDILDGLQYVSLMFDEYKWCLEVEGSDISITALLKPIRLYVNGDGQFWFVDGVVVQVPTNASTNVVEIISENEGE